MRLFKTPTWVRWYFKKRLWKVKTQEKVIYLTFDDGPIPTLTPAILAILAQYQAQATFFCVGDNIRKHPHIFEQVLAAEHGIANHTFNHLNGWKTANEVYYQNIQECQAEIQKCTPDNKITALFRPPYGKLNKAQAQYLLQHQYTIAMWDVLSYDFDTQVSPQECLDKTIQHTEAGSIVVFHDNLKATDRVLYALPYFIEHFQRQGFRFEALSKAL